MRRWPDRQALMQTALESAAWWKDRLPVVLRQFYSYDMRWSYYAGGALVFIGIAANVWLENGWAIWPFLFVAGMMSMVHEAAERNGEGIPPLHVYGLMLGCLVCWVLLAFIFSVLNHVVLLVGMIAIGYQCGRAYVQERERDRLIESRRAAGECIHCGEPVRPGWAYCENCGEEPDPAAARLRRVSSIIVKRKTNARTREVLTPAPPTASAARKEKELLARRRTGKVRR